MKKLKNKVRWMLYRHPALYYFRFYLYRRPHNHSVINGESYNDYNKKSDIPEIYHRVNSTFNLEQSNKIDKGIQLAKLVRLKIKGGKGLGLSSDKTLKSMLEGEGGVCSDIAQAYNNFCILNDIKIRELGIIDKIYDSKHDHSFNEFYSETLNKWIAIDVSKGIYFVDPINKEKLSAVELFNLIDNKKEVEFVSFLNDKNYDFNVDLEESVEQIYFQKNSIPFLISNYNIIFYDRLLNLFQSWLPTFMIHTIALLLFKNVKFIMLREA